MLGRTFIVCLSIALATATEPSSCRDYVLISTRGTTERQGPSIGFVNMINTTLHTVPHGIEYDTVYPATSNLTGAFVGVADIVRFVNEGIASCPDQIYGLLGYSQGASVADISLHNFTDPYSPAYRAIKAVVVIGNPGHVYGAIANVDQNGTDSTRNFTGSYYLNGAGAVPDLYYSDDKVLDICYQGDVVCAPSPNGTFEITRPHLLYGSTPSVQSMGAEFLIRKLGKAGDTAPTLVPGATSTGTYSTTSVPTQTTTSTVGTFSGAADVIRPLRSGFVPSLIATFVLFNL